VAGRNARLHDGKNSIVSFGPRCRSWLLKRVLLPLGDLAFGQRMMSRLRFLEQAQWWPYERLVAERDRALQSLIHIAHREVPLYRELMEQARVKPADIRRPSDLVRLPVVTKQMLRAQYPQGVVRDTGFPTSEGSTSGSTGANFRFLLDSETRGWYRASFLLALEWAGWGVGEPHMQTGMSFERSLDKWLKDHLLGCHYLPANQLSDDRLDQNLEMLDRHRVRHLWGYPGSLYFMARRALARGWNRPLRSVVTWGDNLYPHYRQTIERAFRVRVHDTYGCAEGMHIAAQCGCGQTYHVHSLDTIVEFLDEAGTPVAPGQQGDVILTRLHPGPMPFIRYRVGDVATAGTGELCPCGRGYSTMGSIQGRDTDVVLTPSGGRLIVHFFTGILEHFREIDSFQVVQNSRDAIVLRVVPTGPPSPDAAERIVAKLKEMGAADLNIEVEFVDQIPPTSGGKRRFIISSIGQ